MSGLLGMAMLGGAEGAGTSIAQQANTYQQAYNANEHEKLKADLMAQREKNLADINNAAAQQRTETTEAGANQRSAAQNASAEKIAAERNAMLAKTAKLGVGAIQQDLDGNIYVVGADRKATPLLDPQGNQLRGYKNLTPAASAYAASLTDQLKGLDRLEANPMLDDPGRSALQARRAELNTRLVTTLTGGLGAQPQPKTAPQIVDPFASKSKAAPAAPALSAPTAPTAPAAQPEPESFIPPQFTGSQANKRVNPAYQQFVSTYGETPPKFLGQGRPNPAYSQWRQSVLSGNR